MNAGDGSCGSWLCENADVLRRRRIVFSSVRCSFLLARSSPPAARSCTGAEISQTPWFPHFCGAAPDFRFMLLCVEPRVIWRPCWNEILTIFDPYTFSHTQGHKRASNQVELRPKFSPLYPE